MLDYADVGLAFGDHLADLDPGGGLDGEVDVRVAGQEDAHDPEQGVGDDVRGGGEHDGAAFLGLGGCVGEAVNALDEGGGEFRQPTAGQGELDGTLHTVEEDGVEFGLQLLYVRGDGGLAYAKPLGGAGDAPETGGHAEAPEFSYLHDSILAL